MRTLVDVVASNAIATDGCTCKQCGREAGEVVYLQTGGILKVK